jgi:hypothetical protein
LHTMRYNKALVSCIRNANYVTIRYVCKAMYALLYQTVVKLSYLFQIMVYVLDSIMQHMLCVQANKIDVFTPVTTLYTELVYM